MIWIKICGITCLEDAITIAKLGANAVGFVFAQSPRKVTTEKVKNIVSHLPDIEKVGVFVNENPDRVRGIATECKLDILQFHGDEPPEYCTKFKNLGYKIIKAFQIKDKKSIEKICNYKVDFYLLDAFNKDVRGGSGKTFNWELTKMLKNIPIIISGGLNPANVKEAIREVNPFGVDVSSGVESYPGKKDKTKIQKFINEVRCAI